MRSTVATIRAALDVLFAPGDVVEIRELWSQRRTDSGYFDDPAKLAQAAARLDGHVPLYVTLNPVLPALLARAANRTAEYAKVTTSDREIQQRRWLLIDLDPCRPSGISSTDAEHGAALERAQELRAWLIAQGIPARGIILADSGNGAHLLVRIDLPNDEPSRELLHRVLLALDLQWSDDRVQVDVTTSNAARIAKLYGTLAMKGDSMPDRPHRRAQLLEVPAAIEVADREVLERLASRAPGEPPAPASRRQALDLEAWLAQHADQLGTLRSGAWRGDARKWILDVCPWNPEHTNRSAFIVQFSNGAIAAGCHHNGCADRDWRGLRDLVEPGWRDRRDHRDQERDAPRDGAGPYRATNSGLVWMKPTAHGDVPAALTNFTAEIVGDIVEDDGVETRRAFEVEARLNGRAALFTVTADKYGAMAWPTEHLGAQAIVYPGMGTRDHARVAIQVLSTAITERRVFTHLGWRRIDGRWVYLHAGGAIGAVGPVPGVEVSLPDRLRGFVLPDPPAGDDLRHAIRASLRMLDVAPDTVTVPILSAVYRAPLGETDASLHTAGETGQGKTALAALGQQHHGAGMDADHLPAHWSSTGNALEALAFAAKDALLVVDDFAPGGSHYDVQRSHREADRLLRAQGDRAGRQRMRVDTTLRPPKPPRGLILSTGEDVPRGQSLRARVFVAEFPRGTMDWHRLTACQRDAADGVYAGTMAGYVRWLAGRHDAIQDLQTVLREQRAALRQHAAAVGQHRRTPGLVADLALGLRCFLLYALDAGALAREEAEKNLGARLGDPGGGGGRPGGAPRGGRSHTAVPRPRGRRDHVRAGAHRR